MLEFLHRPVGDRKLRLFAAACCRRIWHRIPDPRSWQAIETTERFIEGEASVQELETARREAEAAQAGTRQSSRWDAGDQAVIALALAPEWNPKTWPCVNSVVIYASQAAAQHAELAGKNRKARKSNYLRGHKDEKPVQCHLLRDIFGNPFRPAPTIGRAKLAWNDGLVGKLAQSAYEERTLPEGTLDLARLAVLADALEEAGIRDAGLLEHLRGPAPHVRGCFALDAVLGRA